MWKQTQSKLNNSPNFSNHLISSNFCSPSLQSHHIAIAILTQLTIPSLQGLVKNIFEAPNSATAALGSPSARICVYASSDVGLLCCSLSRCASGSGSWRLSCGPRFYERTSAHLLWRDEIEVESSPCRTCRYPSTLAGVIWLAGCRDYKVFRNGSAAL